MLKKLLFVSIIFIQFYTYAQEVKFGKVSKENLEEEFYPLDSTADAAYLYKKRKTYYEFLQREGRFQIVTEIHEKIKIYTKEGLDFATKSVAFYKPESGDEESVTSIKGYTFSLVNGKVEKTKLSKSSVFEEKRNKYTTLKKITFPKVNKGSVIEIKYKLVSPYTRTIDDLEFQYNIPVKKIRYEISIPEYYVFNKRAKGFYFIKPKEEYKSKNITYTVKNPGKGRAGVRDANRTTYDYNKINYEAKNYTFLENNIPALKNNEPFVNSIKNYRGGLKFEITEVNFTKLGGERKFLSSNWNDVSKQIYKSSSFGSELEKSSYYKDDINSIISSSKTDLEKIVAIFQFVKSKVKWNGYKDKYTYNGVKKAYKEGVGNVGDINLMLTSMLRFAGLNANPVLVSSRGNGVPLFPTLKGFDYVISMVQFPGKTYLLLDATEQNSIPNILPKRDLNWDGRLVKKDGTSSWVKLTPTKAAIEDNMLMVKISEDLTMEGFIRTKLENLNALSFRNNYNHIKEEELVLKYEEDNSIEVEDFKIENKKNLIKPIVKKIKFSSEDLIEEINGKLYIEPLLFLTKHNNPFKLEERKFPIDFSNAWKTINRVNIEIPKGYKVEKLPELLAIGLPENIGIFKFQVKQIGTKIKTISILQFNEPLVGAQYYKDLKDFYSKLIKTQSEKIVLMKL